MDPLSITATFVGLASTITSTSLAVLGFVKDVRAARSDLDAVSRELQSLKMVLELLADDFNDSTSASIPQTLQKQISGIIVNCTEVVMDIEQTLNKHEGGKLNKAAKWVASGKSDVLKLQSNLEAHKSALEIALDMVTLTLTREIKADTQELLCDTSAIKIDTAQILAEIARLQVQLPRDPNQHSAGFMLERYLDNLTSYAETVCDPFLDDFNESGGSENGSIKQQWSPPAPQSNSKAFSSEPLNKLTAKVTDPLVFTGDSKDLKSTGFERWLLEMKAKVTADDWEGGEETKMAYIQNKVKGLAFKYLEPRLCLGCENPFTTGDQMFEVLAQLFANQDCDKQAWVKENEPAPRTILPKSLETPFAEPPISMTISSPAAHSQENRDELLEAAIEGKQTLKSSPSYGPDITSASTQWSTLKEEFAVSSIQKSISFDEFRASLSQNTTSFPGISNTNSTNASSTTVAATAETQGTSSTSLMDSPSSSNATTQKLQKFTFVQELRHDNSVTSIAFSPDGHRLASCGDDNRIRIWAANKQGRLEQVQVLKGHKGRILSIAFSPDGCQLASGCSDMTIRIWADMQDKLEQVQELKGHKDLIWSVAFSPDGQRLVSCGCDKTIRIWAADRQGKLELVQELKGHKGKITSIAFSPDGRQLASSSGDKTVRIWADRQGKLEQVQELKGHKVRVWSVAFSPDGRRLASGSGDKTIRIWENKEGIFKEIQELKGHQDTIWSVAFSPDGRQLVSGSNDDTIRIWTSADNEFKQVQKLKDHTNGVWSVAFSPDGHQLASGSSDHTIRIWKLENSEYK